MKPLNDIYKGSFFSRRKSLEWRAEPVCEAIQKVCKLVPGHNSVLDMGCAIGEYVKEFRDRGIQAIGFEGSINARLYLYPEVYDYVVFYDLRKYDPNKFHRKYTVCMCLEVAEHIEPEYSDIFVKNLVHASDLIFVSAAPPGQGGHYHVNCQESEYWDLKFKAHGYIRNKVKEGKFRKELEKWSHRKEVEVYRQNILVYQRENN